MTYENRLNNDGEFVDKLRVILQATNMPILQQCMGRMQSLVALARNLSFDKDQHKHHLHLVRRVLENKELGNLDKC